MLVSGLQSFHVHYEFSYLKSSGKISFVICLLNFNPVFVCPETASFLNKSDCSEPPI